MQEKIKKKTKIKKRVLLWLIVPIIAFLFMIVFSVNHESSWELPILYLGSALILAFVSFFTKKKTPGLVSVVLAFLNNVMLIYTRSIYFDSLGSLCHRIGGIRIVEHTIERLFDFEVLGHPAIDWLFSGCMSVLPAFCVLLFYISSKPNLTASWAQYNDSAIIRHSVSQSWSSAEAIGILEKLSALHDAGGLTDEEFGNVKEKLIDCI